MHSDNGREYTYPDGRYNTLLTEHEFLLAVEETIGMARAENQSYEDQQISIMFHLGVLCYTQGVLLAVENLTKEGRINDRSLSKVDRQTLAILCGQTRWEFAEVYCKNMLNLRLNPVGLLVTLKRIACENTGESDDILNAAVDKATASVAEKSNGELASIAAQKYCEPVDDAELDLKSDLVDEFFSLFDKIGTFYTDRDKYETEEEKKIHDRITAIYKKISGRN